MFKLKKFCLGQRETHTYTTLTVSCSYIPGAQPAYIVRYIAYHPIWMDRLD